MLALQSQLQAIGNIPSVTPIVRIAANDPALIKRVLDLGAEGIVVPMVESVEEAQAAVRAVYYPPKGRRGVARVTRAARFGLRFQDYFQAANDKMLVVTQIESQAGVDAAEAIASVEGIDVLFVGPLDLSTALGVQGNLQAPEFQRALESIETAARTHHKTLGVAAANDRMASEYRERSYRFVSLSSDTALLVEAAHNLLASVKRQDGGAK